MAVTGRAIKVAQRAMSTASADTAAIVNGVGSKVELPSLDYDYAALEPVISGRIMEIHHSKHHQAYVDNLNVALGKYKEASDKQDFETMISLQGALRFNGGGHINHSIFWKNLAPKSEGGGAPPTGELASYIERSFGDVDTLKAKFNAQTVGVQGSGWGWLGYDKASDTVKITTTANQDPLFLSGLVPLLGIDVWEHAYYLDYQNARASYLNTVWDVVNFADVAKRLDEAKRA